MLDSPTPQAQVVVFPELSLTGYELDLANDLALSPGDPRLAPVVELACDHRMVLVVGAPVRIESRLHIGAFIVSPDRSTEIYTKQRLGAFSATADADASVPPAEDTVFQPGGRNPLVRFGGITASVAVCADTGLASHPEQAAARGANTYLASMFAIPADLKAEMARLETYAARHSMAVAFANYGGPSGGLDSAGRSAVWSESGELLRRAEATGSGLVIASKTVDGWHAKTVMLGRS